MQIQFQFIPTINFEKVGLSLNGPTCFTIFWCMPILSHNFYISNICPTNTISTLSRWRVYFTASPTTHNFTDLSKLPLYTTHSLSPPLPPSSSSSPSCFSCTAKHLIGPSWPVKTDKHE
ncbi:hypothetical protein HanHA89_Chr10g0390461 [Helianthus annuus]|nr:hypothetical protein HanHA89_Chr10g0390461 [Helianthus annuus]